MNSESPRIGRDVGTDHSQRTRLADMENPRAVLKEVKTTISMISPRFDFRHLNLAFSNIEDLFGGRYLGYRSCNTFYHDIFHTTKVLLAMTRLMHGAFVDGIYFREEEINLGLVSALMHDTGYIQTTWDLTGTGAKYTLNHIQRSIEFTRQFYTKHPSFCRDMKQFSDILSCTGLSTKINEIQFSSLQIEILGQMLGTADLLGQMADSRYLEKLTHLYAEFSEGNIKGFDSEFDLLKKTVGFYEVTKRRFAEELGRMNRYARFHFRKRWQIDRDLYLDSIEKNIAYLKWILDTHPDDYRFYLRRNNGEGTV